MEKFKKLKIAEAILKVIEEKGFEKPSEIQEKSIPFVLEGKDVIAGSATGSGKTLVFASCIIQNISRKGRIQALILTPTRELAEQDSNELKKFSKHKPMKIVSIYGGVDINPQIEKLKDSDVVVGTPGRILDHLKRRTINLHNVRILVLDEADRMLDMGFIDSVEDIIRNCPEARQTMLFSATISPDVAHLAKRYMKNPISISAESYIEESKLEQVYYDVESRMKFSSLVYLLKKEKQGLVMVFCNTRRTVDFVARNLEKAGIQASATHGGHSQSKRTNTLADFHSSKVYVLVCTDVAARGLDIKNVSLICNYDIPKTSKEYIHRIGRTARAGEKGKAISLVSDRDYDNFRNVLKDSSLNIKEEKFSEQISQIYLKPFDRHGGFRRERSYGRDNRENRGYSRRGGGDTGGSDRREHRSSPSRSYGRSNSRGQRFGSRFRRRAWR